MLAPPIQDDGVSVEENVMKKFALCLVIVSMVAFVVLGDINPALANGSEPDLPQVGTGNVDCPDGLVFEQNGNDDGNGAEGDPSSAGDGYDVCGDGYLGGLDSVIGDGHLTLFEWIRLMMGQLIPNP